MLHPMSESKLITCILPRGRAEGVLRFLKEDFGIVTANVYFARGSGRMTPLAYRGAGEQTEKEIVTVVVASEQAESIFSEIFFRAEINRPHGGMMFQSALTTATPYEIPEGLPEES